MSHLYIIGLKERKIIKTVINLLNLCQFSHKLIKFGQFNLPIESFRPILAKNLWCGHRSCHVGQTMLAWTTLKKNWIFQLFFFPSFWLVRVTGHWARVASPAIDGAARCPLPDLGEAFTPLSVAWWGLSCSSATVYKKEKKEKYKMQNFFNLQKLFTLAPVVSHRTTGVYVSNFWPKLVRST